MQKLRNSIVVAGANNYIPLLSHMDTDVVGAVIGSMSQPAVTPFEIVIPYCLEQYSQDLLGLIIILNSITTATPNK